MKTQKLFGCVKCSELKKPTSHTYAKYRVIETPSQYSLKCSTCGTKTTLLKLDTIINNLIFKIEEHDDIIYHQAKIIDILSMMKET